MAEDVTVYYITGRQLGPLSVPEAWCEECDLTVRAVKSALSEVDPDGRLSSTAKPWLRHAVPALLKGGWHPPVVMIRGKVFSQGVVPEWGALVTELDRLVGPPRKTGASGADHGRNGEYRPEEDTHDVG